MKEPSAPILPTATVMYETPLQYRSLENFLAENHLTDLLPKLIVEEITLSVLLTLAADDLSMIAMPFGKRKALLTAIQGAPRVASPGVVPPPAPAAESQLAAERQFALSQQALIAQTQVQAMQSQHNTTAQAVAAQAQATAQGIAAMAQAVTSAAQEKGAPKGVLDEYFVTLGEVHVVMMATNILKGFSGTYVGEVMSKSVVQGAGTKNERRYETIPHGHGKLIGSKQSYEGEWQLGLPDGRGIFRGKDVLGSLVLEGDWRQGVAEGLNCKETVAYSRMTTEMYNANGTKINADTNEIYIGSMVNGRPHGKGRLEESDGDVYVGSFVEGKKHGRGKDWGRSTSGEIIVTTGIWKNGKQSGQGKQVFGSPANQIYEGEFLDGFRHGAFRVSFKQKDGSWYTVTKHWQHGKEVRDECVCTIL